MRNGVPFSELQAELNRDPDFVEAVKDIQPEFEIINQIIKARMEQNLSQADLAERVGTKQSNISRLENGNANPSLQFLKKLAKGLGKELHVQFK